jgi:hypothetical protein
VATATHVPEHVGLVTVDRDCGCACAECDRDARGHVAADTISHHLHRAYRDWSPTLVEASRNAMVIYPVITAPVGSLGWLCVNWAVAPGKRWARLAATVAFAAGTVGALVNLALPRGSMT